MQGLHVLLKALALVAVLGAVAAVASADNTDQNNNGSRYAWGENIGWLKGRPASEAYGPGGSGVQVSDTDVTGYLWGENIGWVNLSCKNDSTCAGPAGNWGVKNDGAGHLTGYAWSENAGWVNFSCSNDSTCAGAAGNWGVLINNYTVHVEHAQAGTFSGYAWGENIGWISFSCGNQSTCATVQYSVQTGAPDSDGDGYTDAQEIALSKNPFSYCTVMRADVNGDGKANILDLSIVGSHFLTTVPPSDARLDQNADGKINILDLAIQASVFLQNVSSCP
jgi:Dockerin type I domain